MPPGLAHALIALAIQLAFGLPLAFLLRVDVVAAVLHGGLLAAVLGGVLAVGFYLGRERRQSEEYWRSNRIPPWQWRPRAARDFAWPLLAVSLASIVVEVIR